MSRTITRLFDSHTEALRAVEALENAGVDHETISIISNNADNWHHGHTHAGAAADSRGGVIDRMGDRAERMAGNAGDLNRDGENDVAEGAGKGAATGGLLGGGAGLLAGLGMLAIPGLGPVVAAGWLASMAVGAAIGAAAGGATGGLLGALKEAGHTDEEANVYSEGVRRGGTLVSVKADDDDASRVEQILNSERGVDAGSRAQTYRAQGWSAFDPAAEPYSADQITRERQLYGENRSFASGDEAGADSYGERDTGTGGAGREPYNPTRGV